MLSGIVAPAVSQRRLNFLAGRTNTHGRVSKCNTFILVPIRQWPFQELSSVEMKIRSLPCSAPPALRTARNSRAIFGVSPWTW